MKTAVDMSISTIRTIEVASSDDITDIIGVVLEIDIEPSTIICRELIFPISLPCQNGSDGKNPEYFLRQGANSVPTMKARIIEESQMWINKRSEEERKENLEKDDIVNKLKEHFLRGETYINDKEIKYFLITDKTIDDPEIIDNINWIKLIDWQVIFDFSPSDKSGLWNRVQPTMMKKPKLSSIPELANIIDENDNAVAREKIGFGFDCHWLNCCEDDYDYKTWALKLKAGIMKLIDFFANPQNVASQNKLAFVFAISQEKRMKMISEIIKHINSICGGIQNTVFISENSKIFLEYESRQDFQEEICYKDWQNHCLEINWEHLTNYVKSNNRYRSSIDLLFPSSSDVKIRMHKTVVDYFKSSSLEVLGTNHCDELTNAETNIEELETTAKKKNEDFLKGKNPDWQVFMVATSLKLPFDCYSALVERNITNDLVEKVKVSTSEQKFIPIVGLNHHPGAGATTVGKHLLWKLKEDYRCAYIDQDNIADMSATAKAILYFSEFREENNSNQPKTVLIFLDNSSFEKGAKQLRKAIESETLKSKLIQIHPRKIIIFYAERMIFERREEKSTVFFLKYKLGEEKKKNYYSNPN